MGIPPLSDGTKLLFKKEKEKEKKNNAERLICVSLVCGKR